MNDQALAKNNNAPSGAPNRRFVRSRWLSRLVISVLIAAFALGCITLLNPDFLNISASESDSTEPESLVITEPNESALVAPTVPVSSFTSCIDQQIIDEAEHPLYPLIEMAEHGVDVVTHNVQDYTAVITKRIRSGGKLQPEFKIFCKIRHAIDHEDPKQAVPFSVYTRFLNRKKGQEAIWVENRNDNKLIAHGPSGILNLVTLHLDPDGSMAMNGNRYPIMAAGMLNLAKKMIEKGNNDLDQEDCQVVLTRNVMVGEARCTKLEIIHEEESDVFEFHRAEIFIDDDRNLPIAFRAFLWPEKPGGKPLLLERYSYSEIKLNVGLTDHDFDPANEEYDFPGM